MKQHIFQNHLETKQSGNEIWPVDVTLKMKFFIKKLYNKSGQGASSRLFFEFSKDPP